MAQACGPSLGHRRVRLDLSKEALSLTPELPCVVCPWVCDAFRLQLSGFDGQPSYNSFSDDIQEPVLKSMNLISTPFLELRSARKRRIGSTVEAPIKRNHLQPPTRLKMTSHSLHRKKSSLRRHLRERRQVFRLRKSRAPSLRI